MKSALDNLIEELETGKWQASKAPRAVQVEEPNLPPPLDPARERETQDRAKFAAYGSPHCARCYEVGEGRKIHPPKCGESYLAWLERWQPKGKPQ